MPKDSDCLVPRGIQNLDIKGLQDGTVVGHTNGLSPRLLSYKDATRYLALSYWTIRHMVLEGVVPHIKVGKRVLIDIRDLDDWISKNKEVGV